MSLWIFAALAAAAFQTVRFMLQKTLAQGALSAGGATFARFVYSAPLAVLGIAVYLSLTDADFPELNTNFWIDCGLGGVSQIIATICLVLLFQQRNFVVGVAFAKTEVILTVLVGLIILGEGVSLFAFAFIVVGVIGVILISVDPDAVGSAMKSIANRAAGLGLIAGLLFSFSAVFYRAASLEIAASDPVIRAGMTLAAVTTMQTFAMALWLTWREPGEIGRVGAAWRTAGFIGITSICGSFGWFFAFTLQTAAYVKAVGQVELIFGLLATMFFFRERIRWREALGMGILTVSILGLVLAV